HELALALAREEKLELRPYAWIAGAVLAVALVAGVVGWLELRTRPGVEPRAEASPTPATNASGKLTPSPTPHPHVDASRFPRLCASFLESKLLRLDAILGSYAGRVGFRCFALAWSPDG